MLFREANGRQAVAQVQAFEDFWHWEDAAPAYFEVVRQAPREVAKLLAALHDFLGQNDMMAYLAMMAIRLVELRRVLKPTGGIYLHCDAVAAHYLKLVMDAVFGPENLRNEIIWRRTGANKATHRFGPIHQTVLFYGRG
jgi:site-specific DNA-methyltransferase (adenine-specific)